MWSKKKPPKKTLQDYVQAISKAKEKQQKCRFGTWEWYEVQVDIDEIKKEIEKRYTNGESVEKS